MTKEQRAELEEKIIQWYLAAEEIELRDLLMCGYAGFSNTNDLELVDEARDLRINVDEYEE